MQTTDRLGDLAHRQIHLPLRDYAFVVLMIAMLLVSMLAVSGAASSLIAGGDTATPVYETIAHK